MARQDRQRGGSGIGLIIMLAIVGYGVFVGIQYVPQWIEFSTVKTVLDTVADLHHKEPFSDTGAVQASIANQLYINQMSDLEDSFTVTQVRGDFRVAVHYERQLNLLYETKKVSYDRTITLD